MLVCIVGRLCWVRLRAKERVGPKDAVTPPRNGGRTVNILHISAVDGPECCEVDRFVVFVHGRAQGNLCGSVVWRVGCLKCRCAVEGEKIAVRIEAGAKPTT